MALVEAQRQAATPRLAAAAKSADESVQLYKIVRYMCPDKARAEQMRREAVFEAPSITFLPAAHADVQPQSAHTPV